MAKQIHSLIYAISVSALLIGPRPAHADAVRSVIVVVFNGTDDTLVYASKRLEHGEWTPGWKPPHRIPPGAIAQWRSESDGFMTGTEGGVKYRRPGKKEAVSIYWNNPFAGKNRFTVKVPLDWDFFRSGGKGNRTFVFVNLGAKGKAHKCNSTWITSQLRSKPNVRLTESQKSLAAYMTPFKQAGFSGWVSTGCSAAGSGTLVRHPAKSTDGFTTIDVRLESFCVEKSVASKGPYIRLEVPITTPVPKGLKKGSAINFSGPVLIDTDLPGGGAQFLGTAGVTAGWLEVHPQKVSTGLESCADSIPPPEK